VKDKATVASPFFGTFPSDRIPNKSMCIFFSRCQFLYNAQANSGNVVKLLSMNMRHKACTYLAISTTFKINTFMISIHAILDTKHIDPYD
jgi:hypothetical protein